MGKKTEDFDFKSSYVISEQRVSLGVVQGLDVLLHTEKGSDLTNWDKQRKKEKARSQFKITSSTRAFSVFHLWCCLGDV